jgi:ADP-heptose:LPS heptosyltransferase
MENLAKKSFTNLLVIMTDRHIGNLLVSLYAIKSAHQQLNQQQTISCVIDYHLLPLANYLLPTVTFIPCKVRGKKPAPFKKISLFISMLYQLKTKKIDAAVDLYGHGESYLIAKWSGARFISAFYCRPKLKDKYDWTAENTSLTPGHQLDFYRLPFLPFLNNLNEIALPAPEQHDVIIKIKSKLSQLGVSGDKPLVVIHPGAGKEYKLWPEAHWQQLIERLETAGKQVLLIGAGEDRQQINGIIKEKNISPINAFQQFNLIETIHLGFLSHCMIGNDSGPTHLMATTPTTVFSLFGPTDHSLWAPLSPNSHILASKTRCLDACSKQTCAKKSSCLEDLSADYVFLQITKILTG